MTNSMYLDEQFIRRFCDTHGDRLIRFSILRLCISMDMLDLVCRSCANLEQLFIAVNRNDMVSIYYPHLMKNPKRCAPLGNVRAGSQYSNAIAYNTHH